MHSKLLLVTVWFCLNSEDRSHTAQEDSPYPSELVDFVGFDLSASTLQ